MIVSGHDTPMVYLWYNRWTKEFDKTAQYTYCCLISRIGYWCSDVRYHQQPCFWAIIIFYCSLHSSVTFVKKGTNKVSDYLYSWMYIHPRLFNTLWPYDVVWRHGPVSTLVQAMACCLTTPSHYLDECLLLIREVMWHSPENIFEVIAHANYSV